MPHNTESPLAPCLQCPRRCGVDRTVGQTGVCGMPDGFRVARIAPHLWEEPPISGTSGSGTVFFSGCNLRCVFCQNREISREGVGEPISEEALADRILSLQEQGVHNVNLVTPTHYTAPLARLLERLKPRLRIPVVWNSGGYESAEVLKQLEGLVDVYLPDFKYISSELSAAYSAAPDYASRATEALREMFRQTGAYEERDGLAVKGVLVRHLVLPGCRADSISVLRHLAAILPPADIRVSVMRQYTPDFAADCPHKNLRRRVTAFEYDSVLEEAARLGLTGFSQGKEAATRDFTPNFTGK